MARRMLYHKPDEVARNWDALETYSARGSLERLVAFGQACAQPSSLALNSHEFHFLAQIQSCASQQRCHRVLVHSSGIVFYADDLLLLVKLNPANSVNVARKSQCAKLVFARRGRVMKGNIKLCHGLRVLLNKLSDTESTIAVLTCIQGRGIRYCVALHERALRCWSKGRTSWIICSKP